MFRLKYLGVVCYDKGCSVKSIGYRLVLLIGLNVCIVLYKRLFLIVLVVAYAFNFGLSQLDNYVFNL